MGFIFQWGFYYAYARDKTISNFSSNKRLFNKEKYGKTILLFDTDSIHTIIPIEELKQFFCEIDDVRAWKHESHPSEQSL